ncbi:FeFe hydrogenase HydA (NuoG) [Elusimicrobium minutum Pei191]|uniref:FeFe hydrogenase HydA (NuoG) n=1 Tax=Elusimicrobium minutum (strain Pei191) TaxID=445932 RepID=B2KCG7_ELUMP|nr:NADH-dependent [FeFe] hydrogenase, group A6 [Elusimicrobium minutum]ACC98088.1 FeFe hydrogenase HydA (NuoG) [Elusimicrobium minutum Pei191]
MVKAIINGTEIQVKEGTTILEAARLVNINIPTLCKHPDLVADAGCGICVVRVQGTGKMLRACCTALEEGMKITTHDPEIVKVRKNVLELILSNHPKDCLICARNNDCELQRLSSEFGIRDAYYPLIVGRKKHKHDESTKTIDIEGSKCILCGRCVQVCQKNQNVWALSFLGRGINTVLSPAGEIELNDSPCVKCGQCSNHCPVGAIVEHDETQKVWDALSNPDLFPVVQIAPAVRVSIGEAFGYPIGTNLTGKLISSLKKLGFKGVFDTNMGADMTIMEEGNEFVHRFKKKDNMPLITSCCPAWVDFLEKFHSDMLDNFSTCKSPHEIIGVLSKTYYAKKHNVDPSKIFMVSIMPCTAKKYEIHRSEEMFASGHQDIDISLTTRELARMIKQSGIDFKNIEDQKADSILGAYSGAGTIFGATGGVMEAALRTAYHVITGKELSKVEFKQVRGLKGIKEANIDIDGTTVRVAIAHGLANVDHLLKEIEKTKAEGKPSPYDFVEVMACEGGCVGGGGQPYGVTDELRKKRAAGLYKDDESSKVRCSHLNPAVIQVYKEFVGEPLGPQAHKLFHNKYTKRKTYKK